jgi:ATP-dependent protease HslVU (ClpYQ) peptidase subunit
MTCVVAIKHNGSVYMGADSAGSDLYTIRTRIDPKIHKVGAFMFGFTTSFRMGQLLAHAFKAPDRDPRISTEKFMSTSFIDAVRDCLKAGGWASKANETEQGGTFLVAYEGRVFCIYGDYQVGESALSYEAVGCGTDFAMGSLYSTQDTALTPGERINKALQAAESFSCGVRGPFIQHVQAAKAEIA